MEERTEPAAAAGTCGCGKEKEGAQPNRLSRYPLHFPALVDEPHSPLRQGQMTSHIDEHMGLRPEDIHGQQDNDDEVRGRFLSCVAVFCTVIAGHGPEPGKSASCVSLTSVGMRWPLRRVFVRTKQEDAVQRAARLIHNASSVSVFTGAGDIRDVYLHSVKHKRWHVTRRHMKIALCAPTISCNAG
jgi:hypothetical protein